MKAAYHPGEDVAGCVVVSERPGGLVTFRCPCGVTFATTRYFIRRAVKYGHPLCCPSCEPSTLARPVILPFSATEAEPRSEKAREAVAMFRRGGVGFREVAAALGIKKQTAEKFYLRWVVLPRMIELEALVKSLAERCAGQGELLSRRADECRR